MDLGNLAEFGRSSSATAWATNPMRKALWWLVAPYFRAAGTQIANAVDAKIAAVAAETEKSAGAKIAAVAAEAEKSAGAKIAAVAAEAEKSAGAKADLRIVGLRKDASAVAYRIAGLEEEAGNLDERIAVLGRDLKLAIQGTEERLEKLEHRLDESKQPDGAIPVGDHPNGLVIAAAPTGERFLVRQHDHIGSRVIAGEEWEPHVREAIEEAARPDGIAIDVGAYIGIHTVTMSRCFSAVHAFEPQRAIFQVLCGNLALNDRLNVITHNTALYDRTTAMRVASREHQEVDVPMLSGEIDYSHLQNAAALSFEIAEPNDKQVDAITLDDLGLENVSLIKIDAQGADLRVLVGAERTISKSKPVVLFEWERDLGAMHGATLGGFFDFFHKLNYDVVVLHETTPGRQADYIAKPREGETTSTPTSC